MNKLSILVVPLSVSLSQSSTRQLRRTSLTVASDWLQSGVESMMAEKKAPMMQAAPEVEELTPEEEFNNFVDSVTGGLNMFRDQVQGFMKGLLDSLKNDEMKGCVTDLGYWQQATLDAVKNDQGLQDYVAAVSKPLVECNQEEQAAPVMEAAAPVEEDTTAPADEEAAPADEETAAPVDPNTGEPVVQDEEVASSSAEDEPESAVVEEETTPAPATTVVGWRRMQTPTPKETLDDVLDAWVDYVEETLVKGKECGDKWMEYGLAVGDLYEQGWENNTGLYTLQTEQMKLLNDAWRACL